MSYEHRSNVKPRRIPKVIKVISLIIVILVILYFFAPTFLSNIFTRTISPLWNLGKPNKEELAEMIVSVEYRDAIIDELREENYALKSMLGRNASSTLLFAYILKKPPFTAYDSFIIDIGSNDGVYVGEKVYAPEKILIGEIAEVDFNTSKVKLYSSFGERYEVSIGVGTSTENIQASASGLGGGAFEILLPRDVEVKDGTPITIPSLDPNIFGIVKKVIDNHGKTFSTVLFSQPINIYELKWVELYRQ